MNSRNRKPTGMVSGGGIAVGLNEAAMAMTNEDYEREVARRRADTLAQVGARIATRATILQSTLDDLAQDIYEAMQANGFWSGQQDNFGSKTALVHSELSEMLEANRKSIEHDDKVPDFTGEEAEAADTVIRLLDMAGRYRWRLGEAVTAKMLYNLTRPFKHGKKY
jgi:hypothetical protein